MVSPAARRDVRFHRLSIFPLASFLMALAKPQSGRLGILGPGEAQRLVPGKPGVAAAILRLEDQFPFRRVGNTIIYALGRRAAPRGQ